MEQSLKTQPGWRSPVLLLLLFGPLLALLFVYGRPIPQDPGYHVFADFRSGLGLQNFGNVASNLPFLAVGAAGAAWCYRATGLGARLSWIVFFLGVALVFFGSGYYHWSPSDDSLVWDRLPMTVAFMGLLAALLSEHLARAREHALLFAALAVGIASVVIWKLTGDLRVYIWVQSTPLLVIPYVMAAYPARWTHRHYLLHGIGFYALAKIAELLDYGIYEATFTAISGHSLKHLLAAAAPFCVYLMLKKRTRSSEEPPSAPREARHST